MTDRPTFEEWKQLVAEVDPTLQNSLKHHTFWPELYDQGLSPEVAAPIGAAKAAEIKAAEMKAAALKTILSNNPNGKKLGT